MALAAAGAVAGEAKLDPAARAKAIAPFVDEQTFAVGHVDLTRIAVPPLFDLLGQQRAGLKDELGDAQAALEAAHRSLVDAGVKELYAVFTLAGGLRQPPLFFVVPAEPGTDEKAVQKAAPGLVIERQGDMLVAAWRHEMLAQIREAKPDPRPDLAVAFQAEGDAAAGLLVLPPKHYRRVLEETTAELPEALGGGPSRVLTRGLRWAALSIDGPPRPAVRLVIQSDDALAAEALRTKLAALMRQAGQFKRVRQYIPKFDEAVALLTPRVEGDRLTLTLDEKNQGLAHALAVLVPPVELVREKVARRQSINSLKHMALAMHNYYDVHKQFPLPGSLSADKKPLLSWRVQVLPYLDQMELYKQFHLDEPWDSPHNRTLIPKMPDVYRLSISKNREPGRTNYAVPVGNGAAFSLDRPTRFQDITVPGGAIVASGPLAVEVEDDDALDLPRLVLDFNRRDFGRLRSLIDAINDF